MSSDFTLGRAKGTVCTSSSVGASEATSDVPSGGSKSRARVTSECAVGPSSPPVARGARLMSRGSKWRCWPGVVRRPIRSGESVCPKAVPIRVERPPSIDCSETEGVRRAGRQRAMRARGAAVGGVRARGTAVGGVAGRVRSSCGRCARVRSRYAGTATVPRQLRLRPLRQLRTAGADDIRAGGRAGGG